MNAVVHWLDAFGPNAWSVKTMTDSVDGIFVCAGSEARQARAATAVDAQGLKGTTVKAQVRVIRLWSRLKRSLASVSSHAAFFFSVPTTSNWTSCHLCLLTQHVLANVQIINPPIFGVIAGVVVGLSPAGPLLFLAPSASAAKMPFELKIMVGELHTK